MSEISGDLLFSEILSRLPVEDLLRYKCVCKVWRHTIDHPSFIQRHLDRQIPNSSNASAIAQLLNRVKLFYSLSIQSGHDRKIVEAKHFYHELFKNCVVSYVLANSCRGIMLVEGTDSNKYLWNPFTRQHRKLPPLMVAEPPLGATYHAFFGLGYDSPSDDYKVVRIDQFRDIYVGGFRFKTHAYSLKLNTWTRIKEDLSWHSSPLRGGVFLNRALHYIANTFADFIVALDLGTEDYNVLPLPFAYNDILSLVVLSGCLGLTCTDHAGGVNLWLMKEYGVENSWVKLTSIGDIWSATLKPLTYSKDDNGREQILIQLNEYKLHWLDLQTNSTTEVKISGRPDILSYQTCAESLVRLDSDVRGVKRSRREMINSK